MAEALGIASGIAGIVSLGITICSGFDTYFSAIKDRDDDLKRASDLVSLLRRYIELIRPSASTLSSRHAQATDLVVLALGSCEAELRALKELVDNLNKVDGASDVARKWDKSKSVITYPFQRKKLTQIQDQLLKATGALGTVIQALILHVGVSVGDDLQAFRTAVQDNHLVTAAFLTRIESKVERVKVSTQQTEERLTAISTGLEEQKALASNSQTLIKDTSLMVSGKLDAIAEGLRLGRHSQTVGTAQQKDIPLYLRNAMTENECIQETTMEPCSCRRQKGGTGSQPLTTYRYWGGLAISYQAMSNGGHQPGCCFYKRSTKTTITYTGLRALLSKIVSFSRQSDYQCGGSFTTHSLRTYNVRETSQAFDVFEAYQYYHSRIDIKARVQKDIKRLQLAYSSGKASPFDVDKFGCNVAHLCVRSYHDLTSVMEVMEVSQGDEGLKMMLRFLQQVGVNVYVGTDFDRYNFLGPVYDVLANCESQFDLVLDYESDATNLLKPLFLDVLKERPDIMEALGYSTLFLAVAKRDEAKLKELVESIKFAEYVRETDLFGQNIMHFCLNWETGLRLLLEKEASRRLVSQPDARGSTPLMDALQLSESACQEPFGRDLCSGCGCSVIVRLLLDTDCPMGLHLIAALSEFIASVRAKIVLLEHLAQRRERLQKLALYYLPESELRDLGVSRNELPDMTAPTIWVRLQSLHQSSVVKVLHNGLNPLTENDHSGHVQQGIFHLLKDSKDAEVAFNLGFKGTNTPDRDGTTPIIHLALTSQIFAGSEKPLLYANWLLGNGARIDYCTNSLGISAAHDLASSFGWWIRLSLLNWPRYRMPKKTVPLLSALIHSTAQSILPCPCTTEELSRPLHHIVASSLSYMSNPVPPQAQPMTLSFAEQYSLALRLHSYLRIIASDVDVTYLAKSIIRVLTMEALSISHLPQCRDWPIYSKERVQEVKEEEEWDAMLDEDPILIEKLNELSQEFEQGFCNRNLSIKDFLRLHWRPRIRQVLRQVRRERHTVDESYRKELRRVGVVLDDEFEQDVYPDSDDTPEWDDDSEDDGYADNDSADDDSADDD